MNDSSTYRWLVGAALAVLGLVGLLISSRAHDAAMYWTGLLFFVFSIVLIFGLIRDGTTERQGGGAHGHGA